MSSFLETLAKKSGGKVETISPEGFGKSALTFDGHKKQWISNINESIRINKERLSIWREHDAVRAKAEDTEKHKATEVVLRGILNIPKGKDNIASPDIADICKFNGSGHRYRVLLRKNAITIPLGEGKNMNELSFPNNLTDVGLEKCIEFMMSVVKGFESGDADEMIKVWLKKKTERDAETKRKIKKATTERKTMGLSKEDYKVFCEERRKKERLEAMTP